MNLARSSPKSSAVSNSKVSSKKTSSFTWLLLTTPFFLIALLAFLRPNNERKGEFQIRVEETYKKVIPCLRLGGTLNGQYPLRYSSDLEAHYHEMLTATAPFRGLPPHGGSGGYPGSMQGAIIFKN